MKIRLLLRLTTAGLTLPIASVCHGGRVWAESQPAHGATIYFSLPDRSHATL